MASRSVERTMDLVGEAVKGGFQASDGQLHEGRRRIDKVSEVRPSPEFQDLGVPIASGVLMRGSVVSLYDNRICLWLCRVEEMISIRIERCWCPITRGDNREHRF